MFSLLLHELSQVLEFFRFSFLSNPHQFLRGETSCIQVLIRLIQDIDKVKFQVPKSKEERLDLI